MQTLVTFNPLGNRAKAQLEEILGPIHITEQKGEENTCGFLQENKMSPDLFFACLVHYHGNSTDSYDLYHSHREKRFIVLTGKGLWREHVVSNTSKRHHCKEGVICIDEIAKEVFSQEELDTLLAMA